MTVQNPLPILRRNAIQGIAHILPNILVEVFVQAQRAAGVLDEEVEHADFVVAELGEFGDDVVCD